MPTPSLESATLSDEEKAQYEPLTVYPPTLTELERQNRVIFEAHLKDLDGPPVTITNFVDGTTPSRQFRFINECINAPDVHPLGDDWIVGCECTRCEETESCSCILNSDHDLFPYYGSGPNKGCLAAKYSRTGDHIYECTSNCGCKGKCPNVMVQLGRKIPLEIFKTLDRGWGLRCPVELRRGEFIDTYRGERIRDAEAERRGKERDAAGEHDKYFFDLDKFKPPETIPRHQFLEEFPEKLDWHRGLVREGKIHIEKDDDGEELWANPAYADWENEDSGVVIDGRDMGGPTRWINHSCDPNCQIMTASTIHLDKKVYHLAFFTTRQVKAYEELTFDYKGANDGEAISDEAATRLSMEKGYPIPKCLCGAQNCRRYFFE